MMKNLTILLALLTVIACEPTPKNTQDTAVQEYGNPAADGFNSENSDEEAIALADEVMDAMGGREAWDATQALSWNFFGFRKLFWDKENGMVRVENVRDDLKIIVNIETKEGQVFKDGAEVTHPDSLAFYLDRGYKIWVNDAYWLVMPFKLKDSGVTLGYLGKDTTATGEKADLLQLTFEAVGVTPQNAYHVWVSESDKLVTQWAYFATAEQEEPNFVNPWLEYKTYGKILLSGSRGERQLSDIKVWEDIPEDMFTDIASAKL